MIKNETKIGYSLALYEIAKEENKLNLFFEQSNTIILILNNDPEFETFLNNNNFSFDDKEKIIDKIFIDFHYSFINTMKILVIKRQFKYFKYILESLIKNLENDLNIKNGIVYSTEKLTLTKINNLQKKLSNEYKCKIFLKNLIDKELIGGFKIVIENSVIENSIKSNLENLKKDLINKKIGGN